jgi:hypothetical protein
MEAGTNMKGGNDNGRDFTNHASANQIVTGARIKPVVLGSVFLGAKFIFHSAEILGPEYDSVRKPPYEGQVLTVVGLRPRLKNNVVVRESNGRYSLMPVDMVEKALSLRPLQASWEGTHSQSTEEHEP